MRLSHPILWKQYLVYALVSLALGVNFIIATPAFMPLSTPKFPVGLPFVGCGLLLLVFLVPLKSDHNWLRRFMALTLGIFLFWAGALTVDFVRLSQTSMQLPICYIGLLAWGYFLLEEPPINPATAKLDTGIEK